MVELAPASGAGATSEKLAKSRKTIAENFDTFLTILTTQLKNQNPLDPLDTNQFTQQLVQFTGVEQQLKTNEYLENLIKANEGAFASQAVSYIGKAVTAFGSVAEHDGTKGAEWTYGLTQDAPKTKVTIKNSSGAVVFSEEVSLKRGEHTYKWNGKNKDGTTLPAGAYSIDLDAKTAEGKTVKTYTMTTGVVKAVDFVGKEPILLINGNKVPLSKVGKIGLPTA